MMTFEEIKKQLERERKKQHDNPAARIETPSWLLESIFITMLEREELKSRSHFETSIDEDIKITTKHYLGEDFSLIEKIISYVGLPGWKRELEIRSNTTMEILKAICCHW